MGTYLLKRVPQMPFTNRVMNVMYEEYACKHQHIVSPPISASRKNTYKKARIIMNVIITLQESLTLKVH